MAHAFFGELSPFSNFHSTRFTYENNSYFCSEQYVQEKKALLFRIMTSNSALECKDLGKEVKNYNEEQWKREAEQLSLPGILSKFEQNRCLTDILLSTGQQQIVEASFDTMWDTGIPL